MAIKGLVNSDGTRVTDASAQFMSTTVMPTPAEADSGKVASVQVTSNSDTGTGLDGDVTISANTVVNKYAGLTGDIALNGRTIAVSSNADFGVGDKVMIIQMQTYRGGTLGAYEFLTVESKESTTGITFTTGVTRAYLSDTLEVSAQYTRAQIVKVPQYNNLVINSGKIITANAWDGVKGGIVCFKVKGELSGLGGINVDGIGYRPAEGIHGLGGGVATGAGGAGVGTGYGFNTWGGGGGHSTNGPLIPAGFQDHPGLAYGSSNLRTSLTMGAGGGQWRTGVAGFAGGGIIALFVNAMTLTGTLSSKGTDSYGGDSSGGSGAGGSILIAEFVYAGAVYTVAGGACGGQNTNSGIGANGYYLNSAVAIPPTVAFTYSDPEDPTKVALTGDQTVEGVKTFSSFPVTPSSAPSSDYQMANKKYVDDNKGMSASTANETFAPIAVATKVPTATPLETDAGKVFAVDVSTTGVGTGNDGDLTVSTVDAVVNAYVPLVADVATSATYLTLGTGAGSTFNSALKADKQVMILQSQSYRHPETIGTYEYLTVDHITGDIVYFTTPIINNYYSDADGNKINNTKAQLITVPQYTTVTINSAKSLTCLPWDGNSGGILVFKASVQVTGAGNIHAICKGYRFGAQNQWDDNQEYGEGYKGNGFSNNANQVDNFGGGHGSTTNNPNMLTGGGHAQALTINGITLTVYGNSTLTSNLTFGGGGGECGGYYRGNSGGGIIVIFTSEISNYSGVFNVRGLDVATGDRVPGGSGSILISGSTYLGTPLYDGMTDTVASSAGYYQNTTVGFVTIQTVYKSLVPADVPGVVSLVGAEDIEITLSTKGIIRKSPDGSRWRETQNDDGTVTRTKL